MGGFQAASAASGLSVQSYARQARKKYRLSFEVLPFLKLLSSLITELERQKSPKFSSQFSVLRILLIGILFQ
jgi:hypothetical protein